MINTNFILEAQVESRSIIINVMMSLFGCVFVILGDFYILSEATRWQLSLIGFFYALQSVANVHRTRIVAK